MKIANPYIPFLLVSLFLLSSCNDKTSPNAGFTASKTSVQIDEQVIFTNTSENATSYEWDFGDRNTSMQVNPFHTYTSSGEYTVTLKAINEHGSNTMQQKIMVSVPPPIASFSISKNNAIPGEEILFTNSSRYADNYAWKFGDGSTSTEQNPNHIYNAFNNYTVTLIATGINGTDSTSRTISIAAPVNIFPGTGIQDINIFNTWGQAQNLIAEELKIEDYIEISSYYFHPVRNIAKNYVLYFISVNSNAQIQADDLVYFIEIESGYIGQTDDGIRIGSTLQDVYDVYGPPDAYDKQNSIYEYLTQGIDFEYERSTQLVTAMLLYPPLTGRVDINRQKKLLYPLIK